MVAISGQPSVIFMDKVCYSLSLSENVVVRVDSTSQLLVLFVDFLVKYAIGCM
ncbi:hypothetical protein LguiB_021832 [Lonicera macranthoides]